MEGASIVSDRQKLSGPGERKWATNGITRRRSEKAQRFPKVSYMVCRWPSFLPKKPVPEKKIL
jgi:hypothetical protein